MMQAKRGRAGGGRGELVALIVVMVCVCVHARRGLKEYRKGEVGGWC